VLENREIARQRMSQVFERIGLVTGWKAPTDPFFIGDFASKRLSRVHSKAQI